MRDTAAYRALRLGVTLSEMPHVVGYRLAGEDAYDALDALCPVELHLRDGQVLHSLLLDDDGRPLVDLYLCRDDEEFVLLGEGLASTAFEDYLRDRLPSGLRWDLHPLAESHDLISVNGPWAWEVLAEVLGPGIIGLPYLAFSQEAGFICIRAGKTGEFGYDLLVERPEAAALSSRLEEAGQAFGLQRAPFEVLEQAALENWFFNIRREGRSGASPLELQLQWRISGRKDYPGADALRREREAGIRRRLTYLVSSEELSVGEAVGYRGQGIGVLVNAGYSPARKDWVGLALLEIAHAHAGLDGFECCRGESTVEARSVAPPAIRNRSLFVKPQQHSFRAQPEGAFPPLVEHREDEWPVDGGARGPRPVGGSTREP